MPSLHFLLDASGSMYGYRQELVVAYNKLIAHLRTLVPPLTPVECFAFALESTRLQHGLLGTMPPLTMAEYQPEGGTALFDAIHRLLEATTSPEQHILIVLTDGLDSERETASVFLRQLMDTRQEEGWLCVYLGAFLEALPQGLACGFREGNCLSFASAHLADAFRLLQQGMQRFLTADNTVKQRLLTAGIFSQ